MLSGAEFFWSDDKEKNGNDASKQLLPLSLPALRSYARQPLAIKIMELEG